MGGVGILCLLVFECVAGFSIDMKYGALPTASPSPTSSTSCCGLSARRSPLRSLQTRQPLQSAPAHYRKTPYSIFCNTFIVGVASLVLIALVHRDSLRGSNDLPERPESIIGFAA